jgi:hypothetical protein
MNGSGALHVGSSRFEVAIERVKPVAIQVRLWTDNDQAMFLRGA